MPAVGLDAVQHLAHAGRHRSVDLVDDEFGIAEDRVQGRAQLMAHIGEELGFVLARHRQLAAFLLDLAEQAGILDRDHALRGEGRQQLDGGGREFAGRAPPHHKRAHLAVRPQQRDHQHRTEIPPP